PVAALRIHRKWCLHEATAATDGRAKAGGGNRVSTFYLLPPRPVLGRCLADAFIELIPGLDWTARESVELADLFAEALARRPDAYAVYREELPDGEEPGQALMHGY